MLKRLLRVPWIAWKSNRSILKESILKEISPEYSLEGLMLKLKFQYLGHLMQRTDSLENFWGVWGSEIIADGDCSHEIKRRLLLGRKAMTNLDLGQHIKAEIFLCQQRPV